jgi:hypothetical protein
MALILQEDGCEETMVDTETKKDLVSSVIQFGPIAELLSLQPKQVFSDW